MVGKRQGTGESRQLQTQTVWHSELELGPDRHRFLEEFEASRRIADERFEQPIPLDEGPLVEGDGTQIARRDSRLVQAKRNGIPGKASVVFLPGEPFLLRRSDDFAIANECRRRIMVEGGDT